MCRRCFVLRSLNGHKGWMAAEVTRSTMQLCEISSERRRHDGAARRVNVQSDLESFYLFRDQQSDWKVCVCVFMCVCVCRNKMVDGVSRRAAALPPVTSATLPQSCDPAGKQRREWLLFVRSLRLCVCVGGSACCPPTHTHTHTHTTCCSALS